MRRLFPMLAFAACAVLSAGAVNAAGCVHPGDSVFADSFDPAPTHVYYVAQPGSDGGDGSLAAPFATVQHAVGLAVAGDTICVRAGVYNETVGVTHSGTADAPIVLQAEPGESAAIDGTGLAVPNAQWGLITLSDASYVTVRGLELRNFRRATTAEVPIGIYVTGAGSGVALIGNHIHDIANTASGCAANAFGLKVDGTRAPQAVDGIAIVGNELDHLVLGCSETLSLDGNVTHFSIRANHVHDSNNIAIGAIGFEQIAPDPAYDQARDGTISDNVVHDISSFGNPAYGSQYAADGIYVDGGTRIVIERNRVYRVDLGIELASEHSGRTTSAVIARDNVIYSGNSAGISLGGYAASVGGTGQCSVVNNTLLRNDGKGTGSGEIQIQYHATANVIANNLVYAGAGGVLLYAFTGDTSAPATLQNNLYFSDAAAGALTWTWKGVSYGTLGAYRTASAQDAAALYADPSLLDLATPDLHVAANSPAVGAGTDLGSAVVGTVDFGGRARVIGAIDIGAYEQ